MVPAPSNTDLHAENVSVVDFCHKERKDVNICLDFLKKIQITDFALFYKEVES